MIIFSREYSDESLTNLFNDIDEVYEDNASIPKDEQGFRKGVFKVVVTWENQDE